MNEFNETYVFFKERSVSNIEVKNWDECLNYFNSSKYKEWIYLIHFFENVYAWGTASKKGERIRKSSIFHKKLTGKYDRRVDYLMLKKIFGEPKVYLFEFDGNSRLIEQERRNYLNNAGATGACIRGFQSIDRDGIASEIFEFFKKTEHYNKLNEQEKLLFNEFVNNYWLAKLKHPENRSRTFYYGDCLEPNFIGKTLNRPDLIPVIEKALDIVF